MKKVFAFFALVFAVLVVFSAPVMAATGDITINEDTVNIIYGLLTGTVAIGFIQWLKKKLDWSGFLAFVLTAAIDFAITAAYFGYMAIFRGQAWDWLTVGLYGAAVLVYDKFGYKAAKLLSIIKSTDTTASS